MGLDSSTSIAETVQPLTETEHKIAALWREALEITESPGANDNFFTLGGDSIAMIMVELRIKEEFAVEFPAGAMLGTPSLRDLSDFVDRWRGSHCSSDNVVMPSTT
jgi:acyl carrier protein